MTNNMTNEWRTHFLRIAEHTTELKIILNPFGGFKIKSIGQVTERENYEKIIKTKLRIQNLVDNYQFTTNKNLIKHMLMWSDSVDNHIFNKIKSPFMEDNNVSHAELDTYGLCICGAIKTFAPIVLGEFYKKLISNSKGLDFSNAGHTTKIIQNYLNN